MNANEDCWLTIMVGLPRSGKSVWVKEHKGDAVVVSPDWIRENILGETYSYSNSANAIVWSIMDATLRIVLGQGKDAILDGVNLTRETRSYYVAIARRHGAKVRMMMINTPLKTCLERNACSVSHKLPPEKLVEMDMSIEWPTKVECDELCCDIPFFEEMKP
jgi:predicted kinase